MSLHFKFFCFLQLFFIFFFSIQFKKSSIVYTQLALSKVPNSVPALITSLPYPPLNVEFFCLFFFFLLVLTTQILLRDKTNNRKQNQQKKY